MDAESSIKRRHDPVSMETMGVEGSKSTKRKDVIDSSISEASLPSIEKRRKVIDGSSVSKGKNVVEGVPSKAGESKFFLKDPPTHSVHMSCYTNVEVFKDLKDKLTDKQYKIFGETCFGVFTRMQHCDVQAQMLRCCMVREPIGSTPDAFLIDINGNELRFSIREFAIITGLKCVGDEDAFKINRKDKNWGLNDADAVKIAVLYFIHTYILSNEKNAVKIPRLHFDLVESGKYVDYPWGKKTFNELIKSMTHKMTSEKKFYRLHGMPLAMQVWLYECCSFVDATLAVNTGNNIPRMLNWTTIESQPSFMELMDGIFKEDNTPEMRIFANIVPTVDELVCLQLPPLVNGVPESTTAPVLDGDDFASTPPHNDTHQKGVVQSESPPSKKRRQMSVGTSSSKKADLQPETIPISNIAPRRKTPTVQTGKSASPIGTEQVHVNTPSVQFPTSTKQGELCLMRQEIDEFKKSVKDEFNDLHKLINDNLTTILQAIEAIKGNKDSEKGAARESTFQQHDNGIHNKSPIQNGSYTTHFPTEVSDELPIVFINITPYILLKQFKQPYSYLSPGLVGDVGVNEVNSTGDTLRDSTQEIQGPGDILGDYVEPEPFGSQIPIKTADVIIVTSAAIPINEGSNMLVHDNIVQGVSSSSFCAGTDHSNQVTPHNVVVEFEGIHVGKEQEHVSQYELTDEFLPTQNTITKIVITLRKERRPGPLQMSPYMTNFGSASRSSVKLTEIFDKKHPFDNNCITGRHDAKLFGEFSKWVKEGMLVRHDSSDKNWFYLLSMEGQMWNDEHLDVMFYYFRKKTKYDTNSTYKFTTVDCVFNTKFDAIHKGYLDPDCAISVGKQEDVLCEYVKGHRLHCTVPWHLVDYVFIPVNIKEKNHWLLAVLSFLDRHFYQSKQGVDWNYHPAYKDKAPADKFDVMFVENLPQQRPGSMDCGMYVAAYAEYLSQGEGIPHGDTELLHTRYGALLWDYAKRKMEANAESDNEAPPKPVRPKIDFDQVEKIIVN
ncbi:uncharacterized protein LOC132637585 [Lycium barbarum]|uniref:uncharacterized protein LOC132637585 n=1 Tax=Lycium barbarum TaxID=112863 RepID=UPI00293F5E1D|nr:uncharacterized protein LOC132637585 [Lycium barbarum]